MRLIPHIQQKNDYYCGPAVFASILAAFGSTISQEEAAASLHTSEAAGTTPAALSKGLKTRGFDTHGGEHQTLADIRKALDKEEIVIVLYTEREYGWDHFAIVQSLDTEEIRLIDPAESSAPFVMRAQEFERRWAGPIYTHTERWALYVSKTTDA